MCYLTNAPGRIAAVLVIKMEYPAATWATLSLLVADPADPEAPRWVHRNELFYADRAADEEEPQPAGQVGLYLSDILSPQQPIPLAFCRPTAAESAAGIVRYIFSLSSFSYQY